MLRVRCRGLCVVCCLLFAVFCCLGVMRWLFGLLFGVWLLCVVCCVLLAACCLQRVVCCLLVVVCRAMRAVGWLVFAVFVC